MKPPYTGDLQSKIRAGHIPEKEVQVLIDWSGRLVCKQLINKKSERLSPIKTVPQRWIIERPYQRPYNSVIAGPEYVMPWW
jgi:hypothetical protein